MSCVQLRKCRDYPWNVARFLLVSFLTDVVVHLRLEAARACVVGSLHVAIVLASGLVYAGVMPTKLDRKSLENTEIQSKLL